LLKANASDIDIINNYIKYLGGNQHDWFNIDKNRLLF
jgi:hypothetical protein